MGGRKKAVSGTEKGWWKDAKAAEQRIGRNADTYAKKTGYDPENQISLQE